MAPGDRDPSNAAGIEPQNAIRGLHSVSMNVEAPAATVALMTTLLGEPLSRLGRTLQLPPWEERHRATIEEGLPPVNYR